MVNCDDFTSLAASQAVPTISLPSLHSPSFFSQLQTQSAGFTAQPSPAHAGGPSAPHRTASQDPDLQLRRSVLKLRARKARRQDELAMAQEERREVRTGERKGPKVTGSDVGRVCQSQVGPATRPWLSRRTSRFLEAEGPQPNHHPLLLVAG